MMRTVELSDGRIVPALAFYNEIDPHAAEWLRNLIKAGLIAPGIVEQKSITELVPADLDGFIQCHFFAGIGLWSYGLRQAGWADDRPIWTGSCPCQPFSAAGKQKGFNDDRHLWPIWFGNLIAQCRPAVVAGEQVASALDWFDTVSHDLEGAGYAVGAVDLSAPGFAVESWRETGPAEWLRRAIHDCPDPLVAGALRDFAVWADAQLGGHDGDHIRQRLYFVGIRDAGSTDPGSGDAGLSNPAACERHAGTLSGTQAGIDGARIAVDGRMSDGYSDGCTDDGLADARSQGNSGRGIQGPGEGPSAGARAACERPAGLCTDGRLAEPDSRQCNGIASWQGRRPDGAPSGRQQGDGGTALGGSAERLDHHHHQGSQGHPGHGDARAGRALAARPVAAAGGVDGMADLDNQRESTAGVRTRVGNAATPACVDGMADPLRHERRQIGAHGSRSGSGSGTQGMVERSGDGGACDGMGDSLCAGRQSVENVLGSVATGMGSRGVLACQSGEAGGESKRMAHPDDRDPGAERQLGGREHRCEPSSDGSARGRNSGPRAHTDAGLGTDAPDRRRNPVDWLFCRDGKWRPAEQSAQPLVNEDPGRVGKLRAFGNALDGECVVTFCTVVREICDEAESPETGIDPVIGGLTIADEELA